MGNPNTLGGQGPLVGLGEGAAQRVFERIACGAPARVMQLMHGCSIASDTWGLATHGSSAGQDRMAAGRQHGSSMSPVDEWWRSSVCAADRYFGLPITARETGPEDATW